MYHVESPVDEPSWVTAAVGSLANLEVLSYDILEVKGMYLLAMSWMNKVSKKTLQHKTVVFLGHMNDNSNFTFPITLT